MSVQSSSVKPLKGIDEYVQLRSKGMPEQLIKRKMMYDGIKSAEIDSFFVNVMPTVPIKPSQTKPSTASPARSGRSFKPARIAPSQYISLDRGAPSEYHAPTMRNAPSGKLLSQTESNRNAEFFKKLAEEKKSEQKRSTEDSTGTSPKKSPVFGQGLKSMLRSSQENKDQSSLSSTSSSQPGFDFRGSPSEALVTPQTGSRREGSISAVSSIAVKTANINNSTGANRRSEHSVSGRTPPPLPQKIIPYTNETNDASSTISTATTVTATTATTTTTSKGVKIPKLGPVTSSSSKSSESASPPVSPKSPRSLGTAVRMLAAFKGLFSSSKKLTTNLKDEGAPQAKSRLSHVPEAPTPLMSSTATASKSSSAEDENALMNERVSRRGPPPPYTEAANLNASSSSSRAPTPVAEKLANSVQQLREMESMMRTVEKIQTDRGRTRTMSDVRPRAASEARNSLVLDKFMAAVETIEENDENRPRDRRRSSVAERMSAADASGKSDSNISDVSAPARPGEVTRDASRRALEVLNSVSPGPTRTKRTTIALKVIETSLLQLKEMEELAQRVDKISTANMRGTISAISGKGDGQRISEVQKKKQREELSRAVAKLKTDREAAEALCRKELISVWMAEILTDPSSAEEALAMKKQKQFDISVVMRSVEMIKSEVAMPSDAPIISALRKSGTRVVADVQESSTKQAGRGGPGRGPPPGPPPGAPPGVPSGGPGASRGGAGRGTGGRGGRGGANDVAFFLSRAASEAPTSPIPSPL